MNERRKTEGKKDTTLFLIVKMSVTLPQGHIENLSALPRQEKVTSWGQGESRVPGIFYPPGPTLRAADQASHTQPEPSD